MPEVQATVAHADGQGGSVVLDDGHRLAYDAAVVQPEVLRLHPGQRVRLRVAGEPPQVRALTLAGLPLR